MSDADTRSNLSKILQTQDISGADVGPYALKRLSPTADQASVRSLFAQLAGTEEGKEIFGVSPSLLRNATETTLRYTREPYFSGTAYPPATLFKSEVALLFYDWLLREGIRENNLTTLLNEQAADQKAAAVLLSVFRQFQNFTKDQDVIIRSESEEKQFLEILQETGAVSHTARFIVNYIDAPVQKGPEKETPETDEEKASDKKVTEKLAAYVSLRKTEQTQIEDTSGGADSGAAGSEQDGSTSSTAADEIFSQKPSVADKEDILELKERMFSPEAREQAARFTQIGLIQLEIFHGLPAGTLQNSPEIRGALSQAALGFFTTVLSKERFQLLTTSPEERFRFVREYLWLIQSDGYVLSAIENHIYNVILKNADPETKKKIEKTLAEAEQGQNITPLIQRLAEDPQIQAVIQNLEREGSFNRKITASLSPELLEELQKNLLDAGTHPDKLIPARENVLNIVGLWVTEGLPPDIITIIDEQRFREIFGEDIPYNPEFLNSLHELWIRYGGEFAAITGNILVNARIRFATKELIDLLDKNKTSDLTPEEKDRAFRRIITIPTQQTLVNLKKEGENIKTAIEISDSRNIDGAIKEKQRAFLQNTWDSLSDEQRQQFSDFYGYETVTLIVPAEFTIHSAYIITEGQSLAFYNQLASLEATEFPQSDYLPDNAVIHSPLARVRGLNNRLRSMGNLADLVRGIAKGKIGGKTTEKALEKLAQRAGSTLPGGMATGWLAKQLVTEKGKKRLALLGAGGLISLIIPLQSVGGWILGTLSTAAGWLLSGGNPIVAALSGWAGSWTGWGIEKWITGGFNDLFGGGESGSAAGGGGSFGGGGLNAPAAPIGPKALAAQVVSSTGSQAVIGTVGIVLIGTIFTNMTASQALLADFPQVDPLSTFSPNQGKASEYVTIEKRVFIDGCPGNKCENPSFPITATYSVIIRPKDNYTITLQEVNDTLRVIHSEQAWEEEGKTPPSLPEIEKTLADFPEIYGELGEELTIPAGEQVEFSYEESFDENYNHGMILNTLDVSFSFSDETKTGEDNAITGEIVFVGNYSQGAGCWPTDGFISQLPDAEGEPGGSHTGIDAFDIANVEGTEVYKPFPGKLCFGSVDPGYGNHLTLETPYGMMIFGHFRDMILKRSGECLEDADLPVGALIGYMGHTGNVYSSSGGDGTHLHIELKGRQIHPSALGALLQGGLEVKVNDPVRTCYSGAGQ